MRWRADFSSGMTLTAGLLLAFRMADKFVSPIKWFDNETDRSLSIAPVGLHGQPTVPGTSAEVIHGSSRAHDARPSALRLDRRRHYVRDPARGRRYSRDPWRADGAAGAGVRLDARQHLARRLCKSRPLRVSRAFLGGIRRPPRR